MNLRALAVFTLLITQVFSLSSQPYGNEWIDYSQSYYKFPVVQEGVYRISYLNLASVGFPVSTVDPRNIQVFTAGEEVAIHFEGESDGSFDSADYLEFYAKGNDGSEDEELYGSFETQANPYYSLFTDTAYYYITWNNSTSNLRLSPENDLNFSSYTVSSFVWRTSRSIFSSRYYDGKTESGGGTDARYVSSEGWLDVPVNLGGSRTRNVSTSRAFTTGPASRIHWRILGESDYNQLSLDHHLNVQFAGVTFDTIYGGYQLIDKKFNVASSALGSTNTSFVFRSINDLGSGADRSAISFIEVKYPHQLNFGNVTFFRFGVEDAGGQSKSYLNFTGFSSSGNVWIYDLTNEKRIQVASASGNHEVLIPNSGGEKECLVFSSGNILSVSNIAPVSNGASFTDYSQLDLSNGFIIISHKKLESSADQYATYRNTTGFSAEVVDINELYDQFGFGVRTHPICIRRFIEFISDEWTEVPSNLLLIGKSIKAKSCRKSATNFTNNLVPSFGNPASDIMLTSNLNGNNLVPLVPVGRISAKTTAEVDLYLEKVVEFESNPPQPWMKNILHFAGGTSGSEADRFVGYLEGYENILEDTAFGGTVKTFKKNTTAPIQISLTDSIRNLINAGTSLLTFFGHASSTGGFDQNIDDPENYNNRGKYPLLVGNSCFTGDIHADHGESVSEDFVLIRHKGVIGFLASVDLGFESLLDVYSRNFFKSMGQINYGSSLGEHMKYAIQKVEERGTSFQYRTVSQLMTLHGDPAIVLNAHLHPDYEITTSTISTTPEIVTTAIDSFVLEIEIFNYGKAINDSLGVEVIRTYPDFSSDVYTLVTAPVKYGNVVKLKMPVDPIKGAGFNRLDISVDPSNLIYELDEGNNFVSLNLFIKSGDLIPAIPYNFAIVPEKDIELKASTGFAFELDQEYEFQLDTNADFSQPIETFNVRSIGGVVTWKPSFLNSMTDSMVVFWRTKNTSGDENSVWRMHSFQYIPGKRGWSQDHFHQFRTDGKLFLDMNESNRKFEFAPSTRKLTCQTSSTLNFSDLGDILYKLDAELMEYGGCGLGSAIHIAVLDSLTFQPWGTPYQGQNSNHYFGQLNKDGNCGKPRVQNYFIFGSNNATHLAGLKDMLTNQVPDGNYILAWTWIRNDFSNWDNIDPTMRGVFTSLGADTIDDISNDSLPYIFFVKKGKPQTAIEVLGSNWDEFIYLNADLKNNSTYGGMTSTLIGPSSRWDSLIWAYNSLESPSEDSLSLKMVGRSIDLKNIMSQKTFDQDERQEDISGLINANSAPYMDLDLYLSDKLNQTSPQMDRWMVLYEGVTELSLNAVDHFEFYSDTLQEGDVMRFSVSVKNISEYESDSVLISYHVLDRNRNKRDLGSVRMKPLPPDSSLITELQLNTLGYKGLNTLVIEVNPEFDQPEQHLFNNNGQIPFFVQGDNTNPVLDVTFDGVHILDGDIVSAKPEINIALSDENPFLLLDDTSDVNVFISDPNGNERQYYFMNSNSEYSLEFIAPSSNRNKARVIFKPSFNEDGEYSLRVQARDRSNNESGDMDYRIGFEVINKSTITNLMNYPNPFSTSTKFVFILTGSKVPDNMQIQIMTVSGKIVKNIYMYEMGPIRIGRNVTEYAWDGRDMYGDKLANGVYLYRVKTRLDGKEIEHRNTSADSYFKEGFGKMVILR